MITLHQLGFAYRKGQTLFQGLDLHLNGGGIYGLLGRNGAGKSTLLKLMTGCLRPHEGQAHIFGEPAFDRRAEVLQRMYFLPEEVYLPAPSWQALARVYGPFYPNFSLELFDQGLDTFEVPRTRKLTQLSLGQKKKGLIAFALACQTELLVLDEPSNGLDIPSKAQLRSLLSRAASDERAIVVSTHQVRDLAGLIDPIIVVENGRVIAHLDLLEVADVLSFELISGLNPPTDALYSERVPGGHYVLRHNSQGRHSEPDLEVLFNALIQPNSQVLKALTSSSIPSNPQP